MGGNREVEIKNFRRVDGPTPAGGAYSIIYYYDDNSNSVSEEEATRAIGAEFDANGELLQETYLFLNPTQKIEP